MSHAHADHARRRAAHLRTLASEMLHSPSMTLHTHSTVDTWHGPQAQACNQALAGAQRAVHLAIDDLLDRAWRLDRDADELEAAAIRIDRLRDRRVDEAAERA
ncbi:MAG: hypothetical protein ABJH68_00550 [Ilumatobacter sp.]|uniref:hypothetical protein n=1 Tax=Ilumatobacter sp. TaxID=1967498 RepID=UPI003296ED00